MKSITNHLRIIFLCLVIHTWTILRILQTDADIKEEHTPSPATHPEPCPKHDKLSLFETILCIYDNIYIDDFSMGIRLEDGE